MVTLRAMENIQVLSELLFGSWRSEARHALRKVSCTASSARPSSFNALQLILKISPPNAS